MAGIFDEVIDGITAKEKQGGPGPATSPAPAPGQEIPADGDKPLNTYSDDFKEKYGNRK
jgi:hypothetical protein